MDNETQASIQSEIEKLAQIVQAGFAGVDKRFEQMQTDIDNRFDKVDERLDRIENILLRAHDNRLDRIDDDIRILKTHAGID